MCILTWKVSASRSTSLKLLTHKTSNYCETGLCGLIVYCCGCLLKLKGQNGPSRVKREPCLSLRDLREKESVTQPLGCTDGEHLI